MLISLSQAEDDSHVLNSPTSYEGSSEDDDEDDDSTTDTPSSSLEKEVEESLKADAAKYSEANLKQKPAEEKPKTEASSPKKPEKATAESAKTDAKGNVPKTSI
jgi:hypothetical protein